MIIFQRIHIELTNRCNFSCKFCPDGIMARSHQDMDIALLGKVLDEIAQERLTDTVYFHLMGEPTLYPNLFEAVRFAKDKGLKVSLTTNGWAFTPELMGPVLSTGIDEILFSIQTPDAVSFRLRRAAIRFEEYKKRTQAAIALAIKNGGAKVILSFLTTPAPFLLPTKQYRIVSRKKELVEAFLSWVDGIAAALPNTFSDRIANSKAVLTKRLSAFSMSGWNKLSVTDKFSLETRVLGDWVHRGLTDDRVVGATVGSCEGLQNHMGILSNGDMVFCCVDYDGKTRFGNAGEISIKDALEQPKVKDVLEGFSKFRVKHPYCKRCLGDVGIFHSLARQVGSIVYFKLYRPLWEDHRRKEEVLCP